jgi:hypothetical protein
VNQTPEPNDPSVADAEGELARLGVQVEAMRALLVRLTQDLVSAESRLDQTQAAALAEVNEHLILAALTSRPMPRSLRKRCRMRCHPPSWTAMSSA